MCRLYSACSPSLKALSLISRSFARRAFERSDMAPMDLVGIGIEVVVAQRREALEDRVDLEFGCEECIDGFGIADVRHGVVLPVRPDTHALNGEDINAQVDHLIACLTSARKSRWLQEKRHGRPQAAADASEAGEGHGPAASPEQGRW